MSTLRSSFAAFPLASGAGSFFLAGNGSPPPPPARFPSDEAVDDTADTPSTPGTSWEIRAAAFGRASVCGDERWVRWWGGRMSGRGIFGGGDRRGGRGGAWGGWGGCSGAGGLRSG